MKTGLFISLLSMVLSIEVWAADLVKPFQALKNKEYDKALTLYKQIENAGKCSSEMYQNMSVAAVSLGKDVEAIIYIEKALKLNPENNELKELLALVLKRNSKIESEENKPAFLSLFQKTVGTFNVTIWIILSLLCLIVMGWVIYAGFPDQILIQSNKIKLGLAITFFVLFSGFASFRHYQVYNHNTIIITSENAVLKLSPDSESPDLSELMPGSKVYFKDQINDWWLVSTVFGDEGWMRATEGQRI